ncbi:hypothetical protein HYE82_17095 [Streptomyces sp. BR123]|uniref:hypothetical protein n=1 Tax=Streptomyces sp. BR123 TaxID=2749828 RepID=UPI0015C49DB5|nr:hypothetical protein [Streptomyces sp. BR123]NXY96073.1 hypothetical protein [Streptomyces sp. BR123]
MGAIRTSATALLSAGAAGAVVVLGVLVVPGAGAAGAQPATSFGFAVAPSTVAPGGQVTLSVSGCDAAYATASSGVFDTVTIDRGRTARATVDRDARRGAVYSVTFTCSGENGSADLTITGGSARPTTSSTFTATAPGMPALDQNPPQNPARSPARGVRGGLGGSIAGMDPWAVGAGAGLFFAAAAGTGYAVRRRAGARGQ